MWGPKSYSKLTLIIRTKACLVHGRIVKGLPALELIATKYRSTRNDVMIV